MDVIDELIEQVTKAEEQAFLKGIETNTVILNSEFDYLKELYLLIEEKIGYVRPMILGKHIMTQKLPEKYSFALTHVNEEIFETELDYYKRKCQALEEKLERIRSEFNDNE